MDVETQDLLRGSVREMFAAGDEDIVTGLRDLGWEDVVADDPNAAIDLLFNEQGRSGQSSSALDTIAYATTDDGTYPVVHPLGAPTPGHRNDDGTISIDGVLLTDPQGPIMVPTAEDLGYLVGPQIIESASTPVRGFHAGSRLRRVRTTFDASALVSVAFDWTSVSAVAHRALAAELVGNGNAMLAIATNQIADRQQFGRPIGANQSPRHRLAESYALLGGAAELVKMAWQSGTPWDARVAKAYAGHALDTTSRACLQVCGAIGLTTEHALPTFVQRARVLDALYGSWSDAITEIGAQLLGAVAVPPGDRL